MNRTGGRSFSSRADYPSCTAALATAACAWDTNHGEHVAPSPPFAVEARRNRVLVHEYGSCSGSEHRSLPLYALPGKQDPGCSLRSAVAAARSLPQTGSLRALVHSEQPRLPLRGAAVPRRFETPPGTPANGSKRIARPCARTAKGINTTEPPPVQPLRCSPSTSLLRRRTGHT